MYEYKLEKSQLFTEEGQVKFLAVRDKVKRLMKVSGACRMGAAIADIGGGSSWVLMACVDRMVELGEIVECPNPMSTAGQFRVFTEVREYDKD